jgi:hypothetical protein
LNSPLNTNLNNIFNSSLNTISDSVDLAQTINLNSGAYFQRINWNLSFNNNQNYRINSPNVSFQNANGRVGTSFNQTFSIFAQGGYSNNDYQSITNDNNSGFYYTLGGRWTTKPAIIVLPQEPVTTVLSLFILPRCSD